MTGIRTPNPLVRALRPASFGGDPSGERRRRILSSPNFADGSFRNPDGGPATPSAATPRDLVRAYLSKEGRARRAPAGPVPLHPTTVADLARRPDEGLRLTWMGHSSVLVEIDGARLLFDPVWGERCSPFGFAGPRRLHPAPVPLRALEAVDAVVISHDHYDHLDMPTIRALVRTGTVFVVPLGVGAHLERWGVPAERLCELDWREATQVAGVTLTATPARHFCGRGLRNQQHTLWASWSVRGSDHRVFHSGDTGYFPGFRDIGAEHGPFDATMIQIGAYSEFLPHSRGGTTRDPGPWPDIHMTPDEGLRAHLDLQGGSPHGVLLPIHWGTFNLALHPWEEPAERTLLAAHRAGQQVITPRPGEPVVPAHAPAADPWWRAIALKAPGEGWAAWPPAGEQRDALDLAAPGR
ncbi:MBL fold metallo-hydrolase [Streptomyces albidoflavus]|uniref:MBL fold metallo-hydrolase n=1 Tax=Streptomyces albidoflavus TaxID=1886 RepID=UPI000FF098ED|nr:MBL fold metallo-hydrolase [Streptomyces albidoflavus]RWZ75305.1 MBL fold metallo-hydrolase [Streptomyces albidoflavus]